MQRNRGYYFLLIIAIILMGLGSRTPIIPEFIYPYLGDYLYAVMMYFIIAFIFPSYKATTIALISVSICYGIEVFQLYEADWILTIRKSRLGALILGAGFLWSDLVSYSFGASTGWLLERYNAKIKAI